MRQRVIVGVVGASGGCTLGDAYRAYGAGMLLARAGAIVLTGGDGAETQTVKDAAILGARDAGGRVISILKDGRDRMPIERGERRICVNSGLQDARNALNGFAADALIAIGGGKGTLTEVAFGAIAGRPVYFVGETRGALAKYAGQMGGIAREAVAAFNDRRDEFGEAPLKAAVEPLLARTDFDCDVATAVERALFAERNGRLLPLPRDQKNSVAGYLEALEDLAR